MCIVDATDVEVRRQPVGFDSHFLSCGSEMGLKSPGLMALLPAEPSHQCLSIIHTVTEGNRKFILIVGLWFSDLSSWLGELSKLKDLG